MQQHPAQKHKNKPKYNLYWYSKLNNDTEKKNATETHRITYAQCAHNKQPQKEEEKNTKHNTTQ